MNWLAHFFGLDNLSGAYYGFWSGVGSDIGEVALLGAVLGLFRHHNCHVAGCWRLGRHPHGPYRLCSKHHPSVPERVTAEHIAGVAFTRDPVTDAVVRAHTGKP